MPGDSDANRRPRWVEARSPGRFFKGANRAVWQARDLVHNLENHDSRVRACRCVCGRLLRQSLIGMYKAKERDLSFTLAVLPGAFGFELGQNVAMSAALISGAGPHPGPEADPCDRNSRVAKFNTVHGILGPQASSGTT